MAKGESRLLSGRIKTKSGNTLDSKRSTFLSLDNAEPNFGNPDSDRYILASLTNGGRLFLKLNKGFLVSADSVSGDESTFEIDPSGLSNAAGTTLADVLDNLDSAITGATDLALTNPTITDSNFNGSGIVSDPLTLDSDLRIFGITGDSATFTNITSAGTVDFSGATIIDGGTVTTVDINGGTIDGTTIGHTTPDSASFTTISTSGAATLASASVTDLTDNRVVIAGTAGELEDDANLTYDGTSLNVANTTASTNSANGALVVTGGVGIGGALNVGGNVEVNGDFTVTGTTTTVDVETLSITDPLIHLADSNESSDEVDIGFIGHYYDVALGGKQHTGIFRDASNDEYYVFAQYQDSALDSSPRSNVIDRTRPSFVLAPFNAMSVTAETLSGTVSADSITTTNLTAASVDINGGTIDGTDITVGAGKTLDVSAGTLTLTNNQISGDKIEGGTIGNVTVTNLTSGNVNIDGGFIDGTAIGHTTPDSGTFTNLARTSPAGVTAGTYGSTTVVPVVTVDASGFIDVITTATISNTIQIGETVITVGDEVDNLVLDSATITKLNVTSTATLASVDINGGTIDGTTIGHTTPDSATFTNLTRTSPSGVTAGAYGSVTEIPVVTVDASGFVDSIGQVAINTTMNTAADTGTGSVNLLDSSLAIVGGVGIDTTASGRTITISAATSGVVAGTYGSNTEIPVITVDSYGQVDSVGISSVSFGLADADIDALEFDSATGSLSINTGVATFTTVITLDPYTTNDLVEGDSNKYYTKIRVDSDIDARVTQSYIDTFDTHDSAAVQGQIDSSATAYTLDFITTNGNTTTNNIEVGTINTLQVNNGNGNDASSTAVGFDALVSVNSGSLINTAFGRDALKDNTSGQRNTAVGSTAMSNATTGGYNTAIGQNSMGAGIVTGFNNAALGATALESLENGSSNTAVGRGSLSSNTSGGNNTAVGKSALTNNTTGVNNVAIGATALLLSSTGAVSGNVAIGNTALDGLNPGQNNNTAIGAGAGRDLNTGTENIIIGFDAEASTANVSNEITFGDTTGNKSFRIPGSSFYINGGSVGTTGSRVGINTNAPTEQLDVSGNAVVSGTINDLDIGHGGGDVATNTIVGRLALADNTSGAENTAFGRSALENNTIGIRNTAIGYRALRTNDSGGSNIAIGHSSMINAEGSNNIGVGLNALNASTGVGNVALGTSTLKSANPGSYNTAIGDQSMTAATDGSFNIAIGRTVLRANTGNNNVGLGEDALRSNTSGGNNIAIGLDALRTQTTGDDNIGIGRTALTLLDGANDNVAIGGDAGDNLTTGSVNTLIGYGSQASTATVSHEITLGDGADKSFRIPGSQFYINGGSQGTTGSNVGIGTNAPTGKVEIEDDGAVNDRLLYLNSAGGLAGGQSGPFYGLYADIKSNNNATEAYGAYMKAQGGGSDNTYGIWAQATQGNSTVDAIGVLGKTIVNSGSTNHGSERALGTGPAAGVYALAETTGTGTASQTTALHASNASTHGSLAYGAYIETISGPTTVVPLKVDHDGSEIFKLDSAGNATISGTVNLVKFEGDSATVASAATAVIATAATSSFNAIEATIVSENATNGNRQVSKVLLTHDTTDTYMNEYAVITTTDSDQFTMDADISGSDFRLKLENVSGNTLYAKTSITYL